MDVCRKANGIERLGVLAPQALATMPDQEPSGRALERAPGSTGHAWELVLRKPIKSCQAPHTRPNSPLGGGCGLSRDNIRKGG